MKVTMSLKEANNFKKIMESTEEGSVKDLKESLKDTNLITFDIDFINQKVTVTVDNKYMEEYLDVFCKYIDMFVGQARLLYGTVRMFQSEVEEVVNKYQMTPLDE